ncbi:MAG TPA: hypothetical protein VMV27_08465 [Candidatus Binataceae bacterium]|nr:hypothetical protein [Candidatus Binataceae bacterium]
MIRKRGKHSGAMKRGMTGAALVLLVVVQLLGAAHVHPLFGSKAAAQSTSSFADPDLCPICLHHCHTPSVLAAAPSIGHPPTMIQVRSPAQHAIVPLEFKSLLFGRAPPAALL